MKMDPFRMLGWAVPTVCMAVAAILIFRQNGALQDAQSKRNHAEQLAQSATMEKSMVDRQEVEHRYAAADASSIEEPLFLEDLRSRARQCGVTIASWTSQAKQYGGADSPSGQVASSGGADANLLKGITKISCSLSLAGQYSALRTFLEGLTRSDRLYTVSDVNWSRAEEGTTLTVTLARYVGPPTAAPDNSNSRAPGGSP